MPSTDVSAVFAREAARLQRAGKDGDRAIQRATGTLARRLPVEARRDMQDEYNLRAGRISAGLTVRREEGAVVLTGSKRGIGLIDFDGRWRGVKTEGATARVRRTDSVGVYGGTFIAAGRGGNRQIFERTTKARLPLRTLYGPSVADMLKNAPRRMRLAGFAQTVLAAEIDRIFG